MPRRAGHRLAAVAVHLAAEQAVAESAASQKMKARLVQALAGKSDEEVAGTLRLAELGLGRIVALYSRSSTLY